MRILILGAGGVGSAAARSAARRPFAEHVFAADYDQGRAEAAAAALEGVTVHPSGPALIADPAVDAVLVTSWAQTHAEHVLAAIGAGKPVFCEKPLATTGEDGRAIMAAETASGRRLVQVGFMRRYDAGYRALKAAVDDGAIGTPLLVHCAHRNASMPPYGFTTELIISDSAIHEIDLVRWLFGEEIVAARVLRPRRSSKGSDSLHDPLLVLLETASGILADVEVFVNATYGYDIRGEVVGEHGTVALGDHGGVVVSALGRRTGTVPADWRERFGPAFDAEFRDWLSALAAGAPRGPSSWDGVAATAVAEACLAALRTGERTAVALPDRPGLYGQRP
jgi:myo-inositol 2-dehydrogenase/D-chiro-inositol 1-dehydrogenase